MINSPPLLEITQKVRNSSFLDIYRPQRRIHTPRADTSLGRHPMGRHPPPRRPLQRMVRILLECIFVCNFVEHITINDRKIGC